MTTEINMNEWLAALQAAGVTGDEPNVFTTSELAAALKVEGETARKRIKLAIKQGMAEATRKSVMRMDNTTCMVPAYRLKPALAKKAKRK